MLEKYRATEGYKKYCTGILTFCITTLHFSEKDEGIASGLRRMKEKYYAKIWVDCFYSTIIEAEDEGDAWFQASMNFSIENEGRMTEIEEYDDEENW